MTNDDLKRLYGTNAEPERKKDFVRYGENGEIITEHDATKNEEVVNYRTLIRHAGGAGADVNYRGAWISGMSIKQYDVVYVNTFKTRQYYMASNDIASSTVAPNVDTDNYFLYLEVERDARLTEFPQASEIYLDEMFQYIGQTNANFTNGYFYKCVREITYYTIVGTDESTYYCAELPALGESVQLYTDTALETEATGKTLEHITTGYEIVTEGSVDTVNTTQTPNYDYKWQQWNVQPAAESGGLAEGVQVLTTAPSANNPNGLKFVVLNDEPPTRYDGYFYIILEPQV